MIVCCSATSKGGVLKKARKALSADGAPVGAMSLAYEATADHLGRAKNVSASREACGRKDSFHSAAPSKREKEPAVADSHHSVSQAVEHLGGQKAPQS